MTSSMKFILDIMNSSLTKKNRKEILPHGSIASSIPELSIVSHVKSEYTDEDSVKSC